MFPFVPGRGSRYAAPMSLLVGRDESRGFLLLGFVCLTAAIVASSFLLAALQAAYSPFALQLPAAPFDHLETEAFRLAGASFLLAADLALLDAPVVEFDVVAHRRASCPLSRVVRGGGLGWGRAKRESERQKARRVKTAPLRGAPPP